MARCLESTRCSKASFYSEEFRTGVRDRSLDHTRPPWHWLGARTARIGHRAPVYFARGDPKVVGSNPTGPATLAVQSVVSGNLVHWRFAQLVPDCCHVGPDLGFLPLQRVDVLGVRLDLNVLRVYSYSLGELSDQTQLVHGGRWPDRQVGARVDIP